MCNAATVHVSVDEDQYDNYCEAYYVYDKNKLEQAILDVIFDGHFWNGVNHYISGLDISSEAKMSL